MRVCLEPEHSEGDPHAYVHPQWNYEASILSCPSPIVITIPNPIISILLIIVPSCHCRCPRHCHPYPYPSQELDEVVNPLVDTLLEVTSHSHCLLHPSPPRQDDDINFSYVPSSIEKFFVTNIIKVRQGLGQGQKERERERERRGEGKGQCVGKGAERRPLPLQVHNYDKCFLCSCC